MMSINEMICVVCPIGCHLSVTTEDSDYVVQHNRCKKGRQYAIDELTNPVRTVTSTVKLNSLIATRLPVKTGRAFPKAKMLELMIEIKKVSVKPPVKCGQVILKNALHTGIDVVSTKTIWSIK